MNAMGAKTYAKVNLESGALGADPHKLIEMLYQGALLSIAHAKNCMLRKDVSAKGEAISKAITIIDEGLLSSLDKNVGGELANNLASLYEYMSRRLLFANLKNDTDVLDEVSRLLTDLKGAWEAIRPVPATPATARTPVAQQAAAQLTMAKPAGASVAPAPAAAMPERSMPVPPATPHQRAANKVQLAYGKV